MCVCVCACVSECVHVYTLNMMDTFKAQLGCDQYIISVSLSNTQQLDAAIEMPSTYCQRVRSKDFHILGRERMIKEVALLYETVQKMPEGSRKHHLLKKVSNSFVFFNCAFTLCVCACVCVYACVCVRVCVCVCMCARAYMHAPTTHVYRCVVCIFMFIGMC